MTGKWFHNYIVASSVQHIVSAVIRRGFLSIRHLPLWLALILKILQ